MIRIFRVFIPTSVVALLVSELILIYSCYLLACFLTLDVDPQVFLLYDTGLYRIAIVVLCIVLGIYFHDLYTHFRIESKLMLVQQMSLVGGLAFLVQAFLSYLRLEELTLPKWIMIEGSALTLLSLPLWRMLYSTVVLKAMGSERVLFLGSSSSAREIAAYLRENPETGLTCLGYVDDLADPYEELPGAKLIGSLDQFRNIVDQIKPDRIVVGMSERRRRLPTEDLLKLRFSGIEVQEVQAAYERTFGRVCIPELRPSQLIFNTDLGPNPSRVAAQSVYSFIFAVIGTALTLPIMICVAIGVKLTSPGPILYRQKRVGMHDVPFTVYKFRSMYANAEGRTGAVWATKGDPRITKFGRVIRKLRFDELPQLFNVLRGEMSIVGPRPERPEFVSELEKQIPFYSQRHCVKPGITGWAQINHKYGDTLEDTIKKLEYDLYYIKNLSFSLDVYIMLHTAKVMLLSRGAQ